MIVLSSPSDAVQPFLTFSRETTRTTFEDELETISNVRSDYTVVKIAVAFLAARGEKRKRGQVSFSGLGLEFLRVLLGDSTNTVTSFDFYPLTMFREILRTPPRRNLLPGAKDAEGPRDPERKNLLLRG